jgi:Rps23 Pro-64 3,4-dihydroxylase Tpa1-like proline 4-hydroxylase
MNDNYIGGEIKFPRFNVTHKPKANELLIFPSGYTYNHSVLPVESGTRYAIVGWLK